MEKIMNKIANNDLGLLMIRIALGAVFINAGWMKIQNTDFVIQSFSTMGVPVFLSYIVIYGEFFGGIAMILGVFVRYFAIILSIIMAVALFKVHLSNGFSLATGGYEYVFVLLLSSLSILLQGSGKYSVMTLLKKKEVNNI